MGSAIPDPCRRLEQFRQRWLGRLIFVDAILSKQVPTGCFARRHTLLIEHSLDRLTELLAQLKEAREAKGMSLADLTELTGMDPSALSKLETGQRSNPTVETLVRYAEAVGKRLVVSLADA